MAEKENKQVKNKSERIKVRVATKDMSPFW